MMQRIIMESVHLKNSLTSLRECHRIVMSVMRKFLFSILAFMLPLIGMGQTVTDVEVSQEEECFVVSYSVDVDSLELVLQVSTDGGKTFSGALQAVSGDLTDVPAGRRSIRWDVFADKNIVFRVIPCVDLGLSVKWATCNVGASKPEEHGGYYQWAGIKDVSDTAFILDKNSGPYYDRYLELYNKYERSYWLKGGDEKTIMDPEDDVAYIELGGGWRMPTKAEWRELKENCLWTWTSLNGVNGYKVQSNKAGYTDRWIFLPAAGYRSYEYIGDFGYDGFYWSSFLNERKTENAFVLTFNSDEIDSDEYELRYYGLSVRPVCSCVHNMECVTGYSPGAVANGWTNAYRCKKCGLYYEDMDGKFLIGHQEEYEAWRTKGEGMVVHKYVDLGLSVKWASCNVGASNPEGYGSYFQWAGTQDVSDTSIYLDWSNIPYHTGSDPNTGWTKDVTRYDPKSRSYVLNPDDDIAHVMWGGTWRMPTAAEWEELYYNCSWTWTTIHGVNGYKIQSRKTHYADNWIFLPAAGFRGEDGLAEFGNSCSYWSSSGVGCSLVASCMIVNDNINSRIDGAACFLGLSVRPVMD